MVRLLVAAIMFQGQNVLVGVVVGGHHPAPAEHLRREALCPYPLVRGAAAWLRIAGKAIGPSLG